jgi:hypothetical protein
MINLTSDLNPPGEMTGWFLAGYLHSMILLSCG